MLVCDTKVCVMFMCANVYDVVLCVKTVRNVALGL